MNNILEELRISTGRDDPSELARRCQTGAEEIARLQLELQEARNHLEQLADRIRALDPDRLGTANQKMTYSHGYSAGIAEAETVTRQLIKDLRNV